MLGFHRRTRSLIPVKDLAKYDKLSLNEEEFDGEPDFEEVELDTATETANKARRKQLLLVYIIFLAEA